ncbi:hypothetical protein SAY87_015699 [Trapa incisa]|uniref:Uncharacterized protein n=1 Tax=Trapa incisa TaxID=236973 RepID=A0AAN7L032_9MYRT|nr:hypothetical protein SAY87_015699 [Trapa incisa]
MLVFMHFTTGNHLDGIVMQSTVIGSCLSANRVAVDIEVIISQAVYGGGREEEVRLLGGWEFGWRRKMFENVEELMRNYRHPAMF